MAGLKNPKAKDLQKLEGNFVTVYFKGVTIPDVTAEGQMVNGVGVTGYIITVTDSFIIMGADPKQEDTMIALEDVSIIRVADELEILTNLMGPLVPENNEDVQ